MIFGTHFRRQARVCLRLSESCEDQHLAERLEAMAADLLSKADLLARRPPQAAGSFFVSSGVHPLIVECREGRNFTWVRRSIWPGRMGSSGCVRSSA